MRSKWENTPVFTHPEGEAFHTLRRTLNKDFALHTHDFFEIELILSGSGEHILNGKSYPLRRGAMYLVTPVDVHRLHVCEPLRYIQITFSEDFLAEPMLFALADRCKGEQILLDAQQLAQLHPLFELLAEESDHPDELSSPCSQSILKCILIAMQRRLPKEETARVGSGIREAVLYMRRHFRERLTLQEVAAQAGLSSNYFCRQFAESVGMHFGEYCSALRMKYARNLLLCGDTPVTDICYLSGYGSFSSFSREFRRYYGETPAQMRKRAAPPKAISPDSSARSGTPAD